MNITYKTTLSLIALSILSAFIISGVQRIQASYQSLSLELSDSLLIICVLVLLASWIISGAIYSLSPNKDKTIHPEKAILYANFIELWWPGREADSKIPIDRDLLSKQIILWAADSVLREYLKLEKMFSANASSSKLTIQAEKVVLAMRRDLGSGNIGILRGDLAEVFDKSRQEVEAVNEEGMVA